MFLTRPLSLFRVFQAAYHLLAMWNRGSRIASSWITALGFACAAAMADPPATQPVTWDLPGLSGTAQQIKAQLHRQLDDLGARIAEAQGDMRSAQAEMQKHRDVVVAQLATDPSETTYQYVCRTLADSQQELATTNSKSRADELRIKIEGFTKRRSAIEDKGVAENADTPKFLATVNDKQKDVDRLKAELAKEIKWRSKVGAAVRGGDAIQWPPAPGATGIIGQIRVTNISDSGVVTAQGELFKPLRQEPGQTEGIVTVSGSAIPTEFLISGWSDGSIAMGRDIFLDQMMRIISSRDAEHGMIVRVERFPCAEDSLLEDFRDFRDPAEGDVAAP
jgi:hypothetical protein